MYPKAYISYLIHFHCERDYFECHEVLEEHWKEETNAQRDHYWVGLIQISVSLYHQRRGNMNGAKRMLKSAINILKTKQQSIQSLGIDPAKLLDILQQRLKEIEANIPYKSFNLPIVDEELQSICQSLCNKLGKKWGAQSDLENEYIIHKHKLRDRSEVIIERQRQKQLR